MRRRARLPKRWPSWSVDTSPPCCSPSRASASSTPVPWPWTVRPSPSWGARGWENPRWPPGCARGEPHSLPTISSDCVKQATAFAAIGGRRSYGSGRTCVLSSGTGRGQGPGRPRTLVWPSAPGRSLPPSHGSPLSSSRTAHRPAPRSAWSDCAGRTLCLPCCAIRRSGAGTPKTSSSPLSLHDALPIYMRALVGDRPWAGTRQTEDARLAVRPRQVAPSLARLAAIVIPHGSPACTTLRLERLRGPDALFALLCQPRIRGRHAEDVVQPPFPTRRSSDLHACSRRGPAVGRDPADRGRSSGRPPPAGRSLPRTARRYRHPARLTGLHHAPPGATARAGRSVCPAVPAPDPGLARRRRRPAPVPNARSRGGGGTGVPSGDPLGAGGRCGSGMGRRAAALAGAVTLPALANLFAVCEENLLRADALQRKLQHSGEFAAVWRPARGWVAAAAPLPGSVPDGAQVRGLGFAFAEGRDLVECQLQHAAQLAEGAPQRLASLPGDFGFIHFQADGTATVVRSCGGLVPFYLWQDGGRAAVATRLGDLVCYILHQPRLDPLVNAVWASGWGLFPDGRTFLEGVAALERGSFAQTGPHRAVSTQRYWSPRVEAVPLPNVARQQEHAERLRELLLGQLRRNLDPAGGNLLSMSGGVDSSALASLAAGVVGRPLSTFSMLPEPSEPFRHEMSYIRPLLGGLRIERSWMLRLRPETRVELLRAGPRTVFHVPHYALCALPTLLRQAPIRVLFGGEFADEVCGSSYTWPDWVASVGLLALLRGFPQPPSGTHRVLRWGKHRLLAALHRPVLPFPPRLPEYIRPELQEEYRAWREQIGRAHV